MSEKEDVIHWLNGAIHLFTTLLALFGLLCCSETLRIIHSG